MDTRWHNKQLEVGRSLVQQGSQALRQADFNTANAAFAEASAVLDMSESDALEIKKLRAQVMNETGFILQRAGRIDDAIANHRKAADLCAEVIEAGEDFRSNSAATNINLAGLLAGAGKMEEARAASELAISHAEILAMEGADPDQSNNLLFGANQNYALILAKNKEWEAADRALNRSMEVVESLATKNKGVYAQGAQGCQQLSVITFHEERYDQALKWGRRAEELSEKAYHALGEPVLGVYVTSQINLVSFFEKQDMFGDAESALFKALEVVGNHAQILFRAKLFYEQCRKLADGKLDAGNLPREEVDEGYAEVLERIEEFGGQEELNKQLAEMEKAGAPSEPEA